LLKTSKIENTMHKQVLTHRKNSGDCVFEEKKYLKPGGGNKKKFSSSTKATLNQVNSFMRPPKKSIYSMD